MSEPTDFDDKTIKEDPDWKVASEWCGELLGECHSLPDRAQDFRENVSDNLRSMKKWIDDNHRVTDRQLVALENWEEAIERILSSS